MEDQAKSRTFQILSVMKVLAWIAFIGFSIKAGAILISFSVSTVNPEAAKDLYRGMDFYSLRQVNFWHYVGAVSFAVAITTMKSYTWYLVIQTLSKINLKNPFTMSVVLKLEKISYVLFGTWLVGMIGSASWLVKETGVSAGEGTSGEFLFMAGLVFIISQVFKRGLEIQSENELTV